MSLNDHLPSYNTRQRVKDLAMVGTPKYLIAKVMKIDDETLSKYYSDELAVSKTEAIERIGKTVYQQALDGNEKSQALYLKTQGASHGWVEKQVIETTSSEDTALLKAKIAELEQKYNKEY